MTAERLFELPTVELDDASPDVIRLAFSGTVELDRSDQEDVRLYNSLAAGGLHELRVSVDVQTTATRHKRDEEGTPEQVVATKALTVWRVPR